MVEVHYQIDWDAAKAASNLEKHGVPLEGAALVLKDPLALSTLDETSPTNEPRWITMGTAQGQLLVVVHTFEETRRFFGADHIRPQSYSARAPHL